MNSKEYNKGYAEGYNAHKLEMQRSVVQLIKQLNTEGQYNTFLSALKHEGLISTNEVKEE